MQACSTEPKFSSKLSSEKIFMVLLRSLGPTRIALNYQNPSTQKSAIHYASADSSLVSILSELIACPDINCYVQDNELKTPLHLAVENKNIEGVQILLSHPSTDVNAVDKNGNSPLKVSSRKAIKKMLVARGA